ncbi:RNA polymerase sigma factor [Anaerohalosphaera lusitana]|uniref:RNA polymerase sigma factor n=1 Tax=Anaerohalosphaera lusitana TaxID=1936003 RepID=UPI001474DED8|nr:sigma-70 family RNA polymerase sigma factor [Anaerohalosphaera lusitana]
MDNEQFKTYIRSLVECKARQLVGKCGIRKCDVEDIEQELFLHLLLRASEYKSSKSKLTTFAQRIIERKVKNILRDRSAGKRSTFDQARSLHEVIGSDDQGTEITLLATIPARDVPSVEFATDVKMIIESLPVLHRKVCLMLMAGFTIGSIADQLGMPRTTLRDSIVKEIRFAFSELKNFSDFRRFGNSPSM